MGDYAYCEKCGLIGFSFLWGEKCFGCREENTMQFIPDEYLDNDGGFDRRFEEEFIEEVVKKSPRFNQELFDKRRKNFAEYQQREQMRKYSQTNAPKCITCGSTNIKKISGLSKAGSVALWGIFSQKVKKQFHCNSCGYEW